MGGQAAKRAPISRCAVCRKRCSTSCGACHMTFYCSKDHQRFHWKQGHKLECQGSQMVTRSRDCIFHLPQTAQTVEQEHATGTGVETINAAQEQDWVSVPAADPEKFLDEIGWILMG